MPSSACNGAIPERALAMLLSGELSRWFWTADEAESWHLSSVSPLTGGDHSGMLAIHRGSTYISTRGCHIPGHTWCLPFLRGHIVLFEDDERRVE